MSQNNVVKYLLDGWKLRDKGFTEADVNHVIGALEVNAFEISQPATSNYSYLKLILVLMMNHLDNTI